MLVELMLTPAERIWQYIELTAADLAVCGTTPSTRHAQAIVEQIIRKEGVALPPDHTMASLAEHLIQTILRTQRAPHDLAKVRRIRAV